MASKYIKSLDKLNKKNTSTLGSKISSYLSSFVFGSILGILFLFLGLLNTPVTYIKRFSDPDSVKNSKFEFSQVIFEKAQK